jgi:hypothetical protein
VIIEKTTGTTSSFHGEGSVISAQELRITVIQKNCRIVNRGILLIIV